MAFTGLCPHEDYLEWMSSGLPNLSSGNWKYEKGQVRAKSIAVAMASFAMYFACSSTRSMGRVMPARAPLIAPTNELLSALTASFTATLPLSYPRRTMRFVASLMSVKRSRLLLIGSPPTSILSMVVRVYRCQ